MMKIGTAAAASPRCEPFAECRRLRAAAADGSAALSTPFGDRLAAVAMIERAQRNALHLVCAESHDARIAAREIGECCPDHAAVPIAHGDETAIDFIGAIEAACSPGDDTPAPLSTTLEQR